MPCTARPSILRRARRTSSRARRRSPDEPFAPARWPRTMPPRSRTVRCSSPTSPRSLSLDSMPKPPNSSSSPGRRSEDYEGSSGTSRRIPPRSRRRSQPTPPAVTTSAMAVSRSASTLEMWAASDSMRRFSPPLHRGAGSGIPSSDILEMGFSRGGTAHRRRPGLTSSRRSDGQGSPFQPTWSLPSQLKILWKAK